MLQFIFWILTGIICYTYVGYTLLLFLLTISKKKKKFRDIPDNELPAVTLLIAAYNEVDIIPAKLKNSFDLDYPADKLKLLWITDGSNDGSYELLKKNQLIEVIHQPQRAGKTAALNRAIKYIKTPITVFTDANTMLQPFTIRNLVRWFEDKKTGCVAGEKKIFSSLKEMAAGAGEGIYWNYESQIKRLESKTGTVMGAAGELYAIRTQLYEAPEEDIVLDDFMVSMSIAEKGYNVYFDPDASASENASYNIKEELKRKIRIAAGGFQVLFGQPSLLNIFKHFSLSFKYISHKVLRWLVVPFALPSVLFLNLLLFLGNSYHIIYTYTFFIQLVFYFFGVLGLLLQNKLTRNKFLFAPFYLIVMNYSIIRGLNRYLKGTQNAAWEKVKRTNKG